VGVTTAEPTLCRQLSPVNWGTDAVVRSRPATPGVSTAALTTETKQRKTIPKRFGIVLELFQSSFWLINIFMHMSKNTQIPKQFQRSQPITDDHTRITLY